MKRTALFTCLMLLLMAFSATAQDKGTIRGTVYDAGTGETFPFVQVLIKGTTNGNVTDFDGKFTITADPGTYTVAITFIGYKTLEINDVVVKSGEVTVMDNILLEEDITDAGEVVVVAEAQRVTEAALLTIKKKTAFMIDGINATTFKKTGDGDAASAAKRVPGVSVEGGKYVFVRGLGDRYTKSILNGVDIPGLDPDRNTLQMDIFPTNVLQNIVVVKSFTLELSADFTGGIVNLETTDFPDQKTFNLSAGFGYNPSMHFNNNYLTYTGSSTDWLGFDNGDRDIPTGGRTDIPFRGDAIGNAAAAADYENILGSFNKELAAFNETSFMDFSVGVSSGNQVELGAGTLGYNVSLSYKNETDFYEDALFAVWGRSGTPSELELDRRELQTGNYGVNNVLIGGLATLAYKSDRSKYKLNFLHLQNGESKAGLFNFLNTDQGANFEAEQHNLEYNQRALTNILLSGDYYLGEGAWEIGWKVSPTISSIEDPDIRFTRIRTDGATASIGTESGLPERIWRNLDETNVSSKVDLVRKIQFKGNDSKLKFGFAHTYKDREFNIQNFNFSANLATVTNNPNDFLADDNLFNRGENRFNGVTFDALFIPVNPNQYDATVNMMGGYVSGELSLNEELKAIVGVRAENYVQEYSGANQGASIVFENERVLDDLDFFPSVNFIYSVQENQNLRFSYSKTIARPSMKEASFATILDPLTGRTFIGGFYPDEDGVTGEEIWDGNLRSTDITNLDFRYETFQPGGQTFSASVFYKSFVNPIEIVQYLQAPNNFQPRNVGDGRVLGLEVELRKNLGFLSPELEELNFTSNVTVIDSKIDMSQSEINSREADARVGQTIDPTRDMAGQAPYIINAGVSYEGFDNFLNAGIYYNVQGRTLQFVGIADRPDVYAVPFHSVNMSVSKGFGEEGNFNVSFKISNLLNDKRESEYRSFGAQDQLFQSLAPGRTFSLSLGYKIF